MNRAMNWTRKRSLELNNLLTNDFCPGFNRWVYWMKHPLFCFLLVTVVAAICGLSVAPHAWLFVLAMVAMALCGVMMPLLVKYGVTAEITFEKTWCEELVPTHFKVRLRNRLPIPVWGLSLSGGVPGEKLLVSFSRIAGWSSREFQWEFTPQCRGVYPQEQIWLENGFPFGLWHSRKPVEVTGEFYVLPKPASVDRIPDLKTVSGSEEHFSDRKAGDSGDVTGTRAFRQGDSLRRVHWAMTARTGKMICTERQSVLQQSVKVGLDLASDSHHFGGRDSSYEWAIRCFAGICEELLREGITVVAVLGQQTLSISPGKRGMQKLLMALTRLPADGLSSSPSKHHGCEILVGTTKTQNQNSTLLVTLDADSFANPVEPELEEAANRCSSRRNQLVLMSPQQVLNQFAMQWRTLCHVAS